MIFCVAHCFVIVGVTHYETTKTASRKKNMRNGGNQLEKEMFGMDIEV